jgi:hypothetical protein
VAAARASTSVVVTRGRCPLGERDFHASADLPAGEGRGDHVCEARLLDHRLRHERDTETRGDEAEDRLVVGRLDGGELRPEPQVALHCGKRRHQWRDRNERFAPKLGPAHGVPARQAVAAGHHQNERVIAQANPTQAALVHRWAALERDAGRLALVAEHDREVELAGDDPWEQVVRLSLDDLDIDAERSVARRASASSFSKRSPTRQAT